MNSDFRVMLAQCEKQAKRLTKMTPDADFFKELDVFDGYFEQLRQIIENNGGKVGENDVTKLQKYIGEFTEKLETYKSSVLEKAKQARLGEKLSAYGAAVHDGALKFDVRS